MKGMTLEMNLPNKLTLLRVILVPFFLLFLLVDQIPLHGLWALLIFAAASVTDALDGHIARSRGLITDFGKFLDPVADKVLVFAALIAFVELGLASSAAVVIMMAREFLVSSMRMVAASKGRVIAARQVRQGQNRCNNGLNCGDFTADGVGRSCHRYDGFTAGCQQSPHLDLRCHHCLFGCRISGAE